MNLIESAMEPCVLLYRDDPSGIASDGMGGTVNTWTEGDTFRAFVRKESAPEVRIAEKDGSKEMFTLVVPIGVDLKYHDVFRRISDNAVFRLVSNVKDGETLAASTVPIARADCERWELV